MSYHVTQAPMVSWIDPVIEPFRNPAAARGAKDEVITSMKQRKEFMARNDLIDGNDLKPPTREQDQATQKAMSDAVSRITPTPAQTDRLRADGLLDIVE
jgi:hypothetical protein